MAGLIGRRRLRLHKALLLKLARHAENCKPSLPRYCSPLPGRSLQQSNKLCLKSLVSLHVDIMSFKIQDKFSVKTES